MTRSDILVTATELADLITSGQPVSVLDVRWELAEPDGREAHSRGHVPGAVYVSLDEELSEDADELDSELLLFALEPVELLPDSRLSVR